MNVQGKAAIVTGASRGVGKATALALAELGCDVLLNYRQSKQQAETALAEVLALGGKAALHAGDVADDQACQDMATLAMKSFGRIDMLVNNAGTTRFIGHSDLQAVTDEDWKRIFGVNVVGPFQCVRAVSPYLKTAGGGEIVNVASIAGIDMAGSSIPYGASKAALIKMTIDLARVLGADNIRVNAVAPGFIEGQWLREGLGENYAAVKEAVMKNSALNRVNQPEDVAAAIVSLITGSDLVTGETITVDGGNRLGPKVS